MIVVLPISYCTCLIVCILPFFFQQQTHQTASGSIEIIALYTARLAFAK